MKHRLSIIAVGVALVGCSADREARGIPELGIAELVVTESASEVRIVGVDATGHQLAELGVRIAMVQPEEFDHPALGRAIRGRSGDSEYSLDTVGLGRLDLPAVGKLTAFLTAPAVLQVLEPWDITYRPVDTWVRGDRPVPPSVFTDALREVAFNNICYNPQSYTPQMEWTPPCGGAGAIARCEDAAGWNSNGYPEWTQLVMCNGAAHTRAVRRCAGANVDTGCGLTGSGGCVNCATWNESLCADPYCPGAGYACEFGSDYTCNSGGAGCEAEYCDGSTPCCEDYECVANECRAT